MLLVNISLLHQLPLVAATLKQQDQHPQCVGDTQGQGAHPAGKHDKQREQDDRHARCMGHCEHQRHKQQEGNWLFNKVAGTLRPRSVAANLKSLGRRSNKSRNLLGMKSHWSAKSHRLGKFRRGASPAGASGSKHTTSIVSDDGSRTTC